VAADFLPPLPREFYARSTGEVARQLLGCHLVRAYRGRLLVARIVETEAYLPNDDPACHAARGRTERNAVMFGRPGLAYVYFTYGNHYLMNVVTERRGVPAAVLLRAAEPVQGGEVMARLRGRVNPCEWLSGPAKLCQAMRIGKSFNRHDLTRGERLWICAGNPVSPGEVVVTTRIGIRLGSDLPLRYYVRSSPHVSRR